MKLSARMFAVAVSGVIAGCDASPERMPNAPTAVDLNAAAAANPTFPPSNPAAPRHSATVAWACGVHALQGASQGVTSSGGWTVQHEACPSGTVRFTTLAIGAASFAPGPTNLRAIVTGDIVRLDWDQPPGASAWLVEVGSTPGLSNLAAFRTTSQSLLATGVPAGVYYVRVRSAPFDYSDLSSPSNEIVVTVGSACAGPPGPPSGLLVQSLISFTVTLAWTASTGPPAASHTIEVGSTSGSSDLLVFDTGSSATTLTAVAAAGVYYVRVRGRNGCGLGGASNEIVVTVGSASPPQSGVFVSATTGSDGNAGGSTTPFATIQRGIDAAAARGGGIVRIAGGNYNQSVQLRSDVLLAGGFNPATWVSEPGTYVTRINPSESTNVNAVTGVRVRNVTLRNLTMVGRNATTLSGPTASAIILYDSIGIHILDNIIIAGDAAPGPDGASGLTGATGSAGGNGGGAGNGTKGLGGGGASDHRGGDGAQGVVGVLVNGSRGQDGSSNTASIFGRGGLGGLWNDSVFDDGRTGGDGRSPVAVPNGRPAAVLGHIAEPFYVHSVGSKGPDGRDGGGGGGGGGGAVASPFVPLQGAAGGGGGQGGHGGAGGLGGHSGGASIGILLIDSQAEIQGNTIRTGAGGKGGAGGRGGAGGGGGRGGIGGAKGAFQARGGDGGPGGTGGRGGHGGSGSGGPSVGIMYDATSSFTGNNAFTIGSPGAGGFDPAIPDLDVRGLPGRAESTLQIK